MGVNVPVEAFSGMILLVRCAFSLRIDTAGAMTELTAQSWSHVISTYAFTRQYVLLSHHFEQHLLIMPVSTCFACLLRYRNRVVLAIMVTCFIGQTAFMCICVKYGVTMIPWFRVGQTEGRCFTGPSGKNLLVIGYFLTPLLCK